jgi:hypothetical protein
MRYSIGFKGHEIHEFDYRDDLHHYLDLMLDSAMRDNKIKIEMSLG